MDNYIINLINSINATCNNARNALNVLLAITVYLGVLILNVNDEALFRDSAKLLPQIGMELKLSTSFIVAPLLYIFTITLLILLLKSLHSLISIYKEKRDVLIKNDINYNNCDYNNLLHSFFYLNGLLYGGGWNYIMIVINIFIIPLLLLSTITYKFLPFQNIYITNLHYSIIIIFTILVLPLPRLIFIEFFPIIYIKRLAKAIFNAIFQKIEKHGFSFHKKHNIYHIFYYKYTIHILIFINISCSVLYLNFNFVFPHTSFDLRRANLINKPAPANILAMAYQLDQTQPLNNEEIKKLKYDAKNRYEETNIEYIKGLDLRGRSFQNIDLSEAKLYKIDLMNANLQNADLSLSHLQGANLSNARLKGANLGVAQLQEATLIATDLSESNLSHANFEGAYLNSTNFQRSRLSKANFYKVKDIKFANFEGADLRVANFYKIKDIEYAKFEGADLRGANLQDLNKLNLQNTILDISNLQNSTFVDDILKNVSLQSANLMGGNLSNQILNKKNNLQDALYNSANIYINNKIWSLKTQFPKNFNPKEYNMIDVCTQNISYDHPLIKSNWFEDNENEFQKYTEIDKKNKFLNLQSLCKK